MRFVKCPLLGFFNRTNAASSTYIPEEAFSRLPVTPTLYKDVQLMAILINRPPQVMVYTLDSQHYLVEMPFIPALRLTPA